MNNTNKPDDYEEVMTAMQQAMADDRQRRERTYRATLFARENGGDGTTIIGQNGFSGSVVTAQQ